MYYVRSFVPAVPEVHKFQLDPTTGFYFDATTGLHYDPNSQVSAFSVDALYVGTLFSFFSVLLQF